MREIFLGWRRKVGCVVLVMSLCLTGMLLRTLRVYDSIEVHAFGRLHFIDTIAGQLLWTCVDDQRLTGRGSFWNAKELSDPTVFLPFDPITRKRKLQEGADYWVREFGGVSYEWHLEIT